MISLTFCFHRIKVMQLYKIQITATTEKNYNTVFTIEKVESSPFNSWQKHKFKYCWTGTCVHKLHVYFPFLFFINFLFYFHEAMFHLKKTLLLIAADLGK